MNSKWIVLLAAAAAMILFAADQPKKEPTELEKLKARVMLLEGRVAQLESRILSLSQTPRTGFQLLPRKDQEDAIAPPNVGEREVNGLKVYAVPLAGAPQ